MSGALLLQSPDGAKFQARAVLEMVRYHLGDGIETSWNDESKRYDAEPRFTRFDNCREQGYVNLMRSGAYGMGDDQINIAFYEHRNSDSIYVQVNNKRTFNAPVLADITETMNDKWQSSFSASVGEIDKVAEFIAGQLRTFWDETKNKPRKPLAEIRAENKLKNKQRQIDQLKVMIDGARAMRNDSNAAEVDAMIANAQLVIAEAEVELAESAPEADALFSVEQSA